MSPPAKFTASYAGIGSLLRSAEMQAAMRKIAEQVKQRAEDTAPVGDPQEDPHAGRYKASFYITTGVQRRKTSRAFAEIGNTAPEAVIVEFGDSSQEGHHTLLNALSAVRE